MRLAASAVPPAAASASIKKSRAFILLVVPLEYRQAIKLWMGPGLLLGQDLNAHSTRFPGGQRLWLHLANLWPRRWSTVIRWPCFLMRYAEIETRGKRRDGCHDKHQKGGVAFALHESSLRVVAGRRIVIGLTAATLHNRDGSAASPYRYTLRMKSARPMACARVRSLSRNRKGEGCAQLRLIAQLLTRVRIE